MGVGGQCRFAPGKENWYLLYRRLGVPQVWFGWVQKISFPPAFDPQIVHTVVSCYTDYTIPATNVQDGEKLVMGGSTAA